MDDALYVESRMSRIDNKLAPYHPRNRSLGSLGRTVAQSYDANSNLTSLTYPSTLSGGSNDAVTYTYDELDRVSLAKLNSNDVAAYTFQGPGRIHTRDLYANSSGGNPVTTSVTYDGNARIQGLYTNPISKTNGFGGLIFLTNYDRANNVLCELAQVEAFAGFLYGKDLGTDFYYYDSAYRVIGERRGVSGIAKAGFAGNNTAGNPPTGAAADQRTWLLDGVTNRPEETTQIGAGTPTTLNRTINSVNEYTQVGATSRSHDRNGNLIDDGTFLYTYDPLNRLVGVKSISSGAARQTNVYDCKGRRVGKTDSDKYRYTYAGMSLIDESFLTGGEYRQYLLGGRGERFKVRQTTGPGGSVEEFLYIEKLDGSIVAHVNSSREMVAYYDYRLQGTVEAFDPGTDGEFFSADDGVMAVDSLRGSYFANGNRHDLENGLINQEDSTRFIDPVNWRKLQPSDDMWVWSQWGLRYNQGVAAPPPPVEVEPPRRAPAPVSPDVPSSKPDNSPGFFDLLLGIPRSLLGGAAWILTNMQRDSSNHIRIENLRSLPKVAVMVPVTAPDNREDCNTPQAKPSLRRIPPCDFSKLLVGQGWLGLGFHFSSEIAAFASLSKHVRGAFPVLRDKPWKMYRERPRSRPGSSNSNICSQYGTTGFHDDVYIQLAGVKGKGFYVGSISCCVCCDLQASPSPKVGEVCMFKSADLSKNRQVEKP